MVYIIVKYSSKLLRPTLSIPGVLHFGHTVWFFKGAVPPLSPGSWSAVDSVSFV